MRKLFALLLALMLLPLLPVFAEDALPEPYEETYRDGSTKNECWADQ